MELNEGREARTAIKTIQQRGERRKVTGGEVQEGERCKVSGGEV